MKRSLTLFTIAFISSLQIAFAQCALVKTTTGTVTKIETPESYFYIRGDASYNSAAVKTVLLTNKNTSKTVLQIKFTTTVNNFVPQFLTLNFANAPAISHKLIFKNKNPTDKAQLNQNVFEITLNPDDLPKLHSLTIQSLILTDAKKTAIEIPVNDGAFLQQQIDCIKN